jgi:MFS transporter, putative metabolite:H+ symporter
MTETAKPRLPKGSLAIVVAALGYFVDIYDLLLFSIVRQKSLQGVGVAGPELLSKGVLLINMQMTGMLIGGVLWGILGDKRGRLSVLFGSIALYSIANIANGLVHSVETYAIWRFIAGVGLAGELGAGITLVSEIMPKEARGYGTTIVATIGILGAVVAAQVGKLFDWRIAYFVGGGLGLALLLLRIGVLESGMFEAVKKSTVKRGDFFGLFKTADRVKRYLAIILVGVPIWYAVGILVTFSPELGAAMGMTIKPEAAAAVKYSYMGLAAGDLASGLISQAMQSRKRVLIMFILLTALSVGLYFAIGHQSLTTFYVVCGVLGFATGYWAVFITVASEQFGTNIRATVTTTSPNFVRGSVVPLTLAFQTLKGSLGLRGSAIAVGAVSIVIALIAASMLRETYGRDLDYVEE